MIRSKNVNCSFQPAVAIDPDKALHREHQSFAGIARGAQAQADRSGRQRILVVGRKETRQCLTGLDRPDWSNPARLRQTLNKDQTQ